MPYTPQNAPYRSTSLQMAGETSYPHMSWGSVMKEQAEMRGRKVWMTYLNGNGVVPQWTFSDFVDMARRLASMLQEGGVGEGDRVAIAGHNHPDTIMTYFACWLMGACAVPLNMTEDDHRLTYIIENSQAKLILCRSEYVQRITTQVLSTDSTARIIDVDSDKPQSNYIASLRAHAPAPYPPEERDMRWHDCLIVYTSGTTGNPKGVVLIQQNLFADGYDIAQWHGIDHTQTMMCVLPVHHVNGTIVTHVAPFLVGASVVLHRKFSPYSFFEAIRNYGVNVVSVVPTLLAFLLEAQSDARDVVEGGFRHIICGAGPLTCELAERFENTYRIPIVHGYGLSETTCYTCFLPRDLSWEEHQHWMQDYGFPSIGVAIPCNEMDIHDALGNSVPEGERGEIVARGPNIMKEYYNNPEANAKAFEFGWFRSGDEGFYKTSTDGTRYYFITGRLKELIIRGGVNLAPLEIDEVINSAPGVKAGICVGFENDMYGEEVGALVIRENDVVTEQDIITHCRENLPFHKTPKVVLFTDELPVTSTGKYQRNKVKHLFARWKGEQFRK